MLSRMTTATTPRRAGQFRKVGENLYRYSSNEIYYAVFRVNGKLIWKSLETEDRELAKRKLKEELEKHGRVNGALRGMTLQELITSYENQLAQFDQRTQDNKRSVLKKFRATWNKSFDIPVRSICPADLQLWLNKEDVMRNSKIKAPKQKANHNVSPPRVSKWTYNEYVRFLKHLFGIALDARAIVDSPAAGLKTKTPEQPIRLTPSWEDFQAIVEHLRGYELATERKGKRFVMHFEHHDSADLIEFMGLAGVGTAECANLKGEHIDFDAKQITLYRSKTDTGYTIPIFPQLLPLLEKLKASAGIQVGQPVFRVRDPKKALTTACRRLKFPHFSPRSLRRCFITRAIEKGVDFKTIASWQGHRDGGVLIAKTYSHLRNEHSENMAKKLT